MRSELLWIICLPGQKSGCCGGVAITLVKVLMFSKEKTEANNPSIILLLPFSHKF